jgi:hypothetical protein
VVERIRAHLTYANVMATVAVFLALGGGAVAAVKLKANQVKTRNIAPDAVTGDKALESSFAQVPSAGKADDALHAGRADTAGSSTNAANATNADNAANANNAANAGLLDGLDSLDIGLGFFTGRVDNLALTGSTGNAPSGVTAAASTMTLSDQDMTLSPNRAIVMRNFRVSLSQNMGCSGTCGASEFGIANLEAFAPNSATVTASLTCNIQTGAAGCTAVGPSGTVPAGSSLRVSFAKAVDAQYNPGTDALFSWQATAG